MALYNHEDCLEKRENELKIVEASRLKTWTSFITFLRESYNQYRRGWVPACGDKAKFPWTRLPAKIKMGKNDENFELSSLVAHTVQFPNHFIPDLMRLRNLFMA